MLSAEKLLQSNPFTFGKNFVAHADFMVIELAINFVE